MPARATGVGNAAIGGQLKFFPGAGTFIGGVINASTATVLTTAVGFAWAGVCEQLFKRESGVSDAARVDRGSEDREGAAEP